MFHRIKIIPPKGSPVRFLSKRIITKKEIRGWWDDWMKIEPPKGEVGESFREYVEKLPEFQHDDKDMEVIDLRG